MGGPEGIPTPSLYALRWGTLKKATFWFGVRYSFRVECTQGYLPPKNSLKEITGTQLFLHDVLSSPSPFLKVFFLFSRSWSAAAQDASAVADGLAASGGSGHKTAETFTHRPLPHHAQEKTEKTHYTLPLCRTSPPRRHPPRSSQGV